MEGDSVSHTILSFHEFPSVHSYGVRESDNEQWRESGLSLYDNNIAVIPSLMTKALPVIVAIQYNKALAQCVR